MKHGLNMRHGPIMRHSLIVLALLTSGSGVAVAEDPAAPPFERTEDRQRCDHYSDSRQPFFGQLHLHTQYSLDAATLQTRNTPQDAYRFARGEKVGLAPFFDTRKIKTSDGEAAVDGVSAHPYCLPGESCQNTAMRTIQLPPGRHLDFAAVTDHAEFLGETNICFFEGTVACQTDQACSAGQICNRGTCVPNGYTSNACALVRDDVSRLLTGTGAALFIAKGWTAEQPEHLPFCSGAGSGGDDTCTFQAKNVWQSTIAAAEEAYDRTPACRFSSFIAYEYTSMPAMLQCRKSFEPCFEDADCGLGDTCGSPGQCAAGDVPVGTICFQDSDCGPGQQASCIANGGGNNLHRNIIFRNSNVPDNPISYIDVPTGCGAGKDCRNYGGNKPYMKEIGAFTSLGSDAVALGSPTVMLETLEGECHPGQKEPCEFLSIPHNANLSGGAMFMLPESRRDAEVRAEHERLVEIFQIKGDSECRYSPAHPLAWQPGATRPDELCGFEDMSFAKLTGAFLVRPDEKIIPAKSYVRNTLKNGIAYQKEHGINPFPLGFVGSLDNHNGAPTATETHYSKFGAHGDNSYAASGQMLNETFFLGLQTNGGGLTVAWAEENSRDSIFAAMHRRETYATSGTRPLVRFFGGFDLPSDLCQHGDFARQGYEYGVPMGDELGSPVRQGASPRFAVSALMDQGWAGHPGATLQRAQIVKGWVDDSGEVHEEVFAVAGTREVADVNLRTCQPASSERGGHSQLCRTWEDPDFDPDQHAFYYARVVENPSCRWNQVYCLSRGVDCSQPAATDRAIVGYEPYEYDQCCSDDVPKAVQQRAWTSPIWYTP